MDEERILDVVAALSGQMEKLSSGFVELSRGFVELSRSYQESNAQLEKRLEEKIEVKLRTAVDESSASLVKLIAETSTSLEREMHQMDAHIDQRFSSLIERLDRMNARVERQGGELITGARWIARLTEWTQATDNHMEKRDARINELETRVSRLESDRPSVS